MSAVASRTMAGRKAEVWARLGTVMDPELDEAVTDLEFVTRADVGDDGRVQVEFRLPTYWCAANFSYLMADDMRAAVARLPWVKRVDVVLGEHMYADKINAGMAKGLSFQETFGDEADGDVDAVRRTFLVKAFQRRQAALLALLTERGLGAEALAAMPLAELLRLGLDAAGDRLRARYLERRPVVARAGEPLAFVDAEGDRLQAETLPVYLRALRRVGVNAEFNGALCRGLLQARFDMQTPLAGGRGAEPARPARVPA